MVDIPATQTQINTAKTQADTATSQIQQYQKSIPSGSSQTILRGQGYSSPLQAQLQRQKISTAQDTASKELQKVEQYKEQVNQYEQDFQNYLKSPSGIMESVNQGVGTQTPIYQDYGGVQKIIAYTYTTPQGTYTDYSPQQQYTGQEVQRLANQGVSLQTLGATYGFTQGVSVSGVGSMPTIDYSKVQSNIAQSVPSINPQSSNLQTQVQNQQTQNAVDTLSKGFGSITGSSIMPFASATELNTSNVPATQVQPKLSQSQIDRIFPNPNAKSSAFDNIFKQPLPTSSYKDLSSNKVITGNVINGNIGLPVGTDTGVLSKIWTGVNTLIGSSNDYKGNLQAGYQTFNPSTTGLASALASGISYQNPTNFGLRNVALATQPVTSTEVKKVLTNLPTRSGDIFASGAGIIFGKTNPEVTFNANVPIDMTATGYNARTNTFFNPQNLVTIPAGTYENPLVTGARITGNIVPYAIPGVGEAIMGAQGLEGYGLLTSQGSIEYRDGLAYSVPTTKEQRLQGALELGGSVLGLGLAGGLRGYNFLLGKVVKPAEALGSLEVTQDIQPSFTIINKEGQPVTISGLRRVSMITPETKVYQPQSRIGSWFFSPEYNIVPAKYAGGYNVKPIIGENPYMFSQYTQGSNIGKFSMVSGEKLPFDFENFGSMPKTQQYTFLKLAEEKTGLPVSPSKIKDVLGSGEFSNQLVRSEDLFKLNPGKEVPRFKAPPVKSFDIRTFEQYPALKEATFNTEGFYAKSSPKTVRDLYGNNIANPIKEGDIWVKKNAPASVQMHEQGHYYFGKLGGTDTLGVDTINKMYPKASESLINKYKGSTSELNYYLNKGGKANVVEEYIADQFNGQVPTKRVGAYLQTIPYGERTSLSVIGTQVKPYMETDILSISKAKSMVKDVSNPLARASGKTPQIDTLIVQLKQPVADLSEGVTFFKSQGIDTSEKALKQALQTSSKSTTLGSGELINKPALPKTISSSSLTPKIVPAKILPSYVGGTGGILSNSIYSGGTYRGNPSLAFSSTATKVKDYTGGASQGRLSITGLSIAPSNENENILSVPANITNLSPKIDVISGVKPDVSSRTDIISGNKEDTGLNFGFKTPQGENQSPFNIQSPSQSSDTALALVQVQKQGTQQKQPQIPIQPTPNPPRERPPKKPTPTEGSKFLFSSDKTKRRTFGRGSGKKLTGSFDVYTKVKRKEVLLASGVSKSAGLDIGASAVLFGNQSKGVKATSASIVLKPSSLPARNVATRGEFGSFAGSFRPSKRDPLTLVQRQVTPSGGRISTRQERRDIQSARRAKSLFKLPKSNSKTRRFKI